MTFQKGQRRRRGLGGPPSHGSNHAQKLRFVRILHGNININIYIYMYIHHISILRYIILILRYIYIYIHIYIQYMDIVVLQDLEKMRHRYLTRPRDSVIELRKIMFLNFSC